MQNLWIKTLIKTKGEAAFFLFQSGGKGVSKMAAPPPLPSKPKPFSPCGPPTFSKPAYSTGTFPGKARQVGGHLSRASGGGVFTHSSTLPLPHKQESPPAAAVRPYTPELFEAPPPALQKPQSLAASSIYSMYTQQSTPAKGYQPSGQGTLPRASTRGNHRDDITVPSANL